MAQVYPFAGWHYDFPRVGSPAGILAPPYDVISADQAEHMRQEPHHVAHLILGMPARGGQHAPEAYEEAAARCEAFRRDRVIVRDPRPAFYRLSQTSSGPDGVTRTRHGLLVALRLHEFSEGVVLPHEETFAKPVADRLALMESTRMSFCSVFGLYDDAEGRVRDLVARRAGPELWRMTDSLGAQHAFARIDDPTTVAELRQALAPRRIFIADGHHRYTAGLAYWKGLGCPEPTDARNGAAACVTACLADMRDPAVGLFPTHRLIGGDVEPDVSALPRGIGAERLPGDVSARMVAERLLATSADGSACWALVTREAWWVLRVVDRPAVDCLMDASRGPAWRSLAISILHGVVLPALLGPEALHAVDERGSIGYSPDADAVAAAVRTGAALFGVLVAPPALEQMRQVCESGERMPHKTTYFYPKTLSGAVLRSLEGDVSDA